MTIKIEDGKTYRTCMGEKVGPMHKNVRGVYQYRAEGYPDHWNEKGISDIYSTSNILAEWLESDELPERLQASERQVDILRVQLDVTRRALRPFAIWESYLSGDAPDSQVIAAQDRHLTYGDVRRARAALKELVRYCDGKVGPMKVNGGPLESPETCSRCSGSGMILRDNGDSGICPECHGDTVAPGK